MCVVWVAVGVILAACGAGTPREPPEPTASDSTPSDQLLPGSSSTSLPGSVSSGDLDLIVLPDGNGEYPRDLTVSCPGGPEFPMGAVESMSLIGPDDPQGFLAAIRAFLDSEEGAYWPQTGWHVLRQTDVDAILTSLSEGNLAFMFLERRGDESVWSGSSIGGRPCELQYVVPEGLNTVEWRLDPSAPPPQASDDVLHVLLSERECAGGREIGDRLVGPQIVLTDTEVRIAFAAVPPPGDSQTCQGIAEAAYTVELSQPLGDRKVIEGMSIGVRLEDYFR